MAKGKKTGGRRKGVPNVTTKHAREAFQAVYEQMGGEAGMLTWAQSGPAQMSQFYGLYARLIPVEHVGKDGDAAIQTVVKHIYESGKSA